MRIDKYLFFARLVKTRALAQKLIEGGHMRMDGRVIERAHTEVRPGSVLTFPLHDRVRVLKIEAIPKRRGPAPEAQACYTDLAPLAPNPPSQSGER
jgi:ribosome-associated heat shock protein Hsp15